jgi:glycosyltransferase involved in cell wall biosynthesis
MHLSIIIPMYNEQETVGFLLDELLKLEFPQFVEQYEIVVVDDCSSDRSFEIVQDYIKKNKHITLYRHEINMGKGAAVRTGISKANGDTYLVRDADLELAVDDIPTLLNAMQELGVEFVNGSRYMAGVNRPLSSYRRYLANRFFTFLTSAIIDVKLTDMACGYKLFKKDLYKRIEMKENRFGFEAELLIKALRLKRNNIAEVPVRYFPRNEGEGKKLRNIDGLKILLTVFKYGIFQSIGNSAHRFNASKWAIILIALVALIINTNVRYWERDNRVIAWDVISYYAYLPATFIHGDLTLDFVDTEHRKNEKRFWPLSTPEGKKVIKTSMGLSILYLPAFVLGHAIALLTNYPADGFSLPYKFFLIWGAFVYLILGLVLLRNILSRYFSNWIVAFTLLALFFGTNLLNYSTFEATMPHVYNFFLFSLFLHLTLGWHEKQTLKNSLLLGLITGLIILVRPTNLIIILVLILIGVTSFREAGNRIVFFLTRWKHVLIMLSAAILVWVPQMIYWKYQTGQLFYFSYPGERFFFDNPQILNGLFSYRKGWLLYAPVMIFSIIGFVALYRRQKQFFWPLSIITIITIYIIFSWWSWWYGGSFGGRAMIDYYPLLAFPLAAFLQWCSERKAVLRNFVLFVMILFVFQGTFHSIQYYYGALHFDSMTKAAYWNSFWKVKPGVSYWDLLEEPDSKKAMEGIAAIIPQSKNIIPDSLKCDYEKLTEDGRFFLSTDKGFLIGNTQLRSDIRSRSGNYSVQLPPSAPYGSNLQIRVAKDEVYSLSVWKNPYDSDGHIVVSAPEVSAFYRTSQQVVEIDAYGWGKIELIDTIPSYLYGLINIYLWNPGQDTIYFDDLKMLKVNEK